MQHLVITIAALLVLTASLIWLLGDGEAKRQEGEGTLYVALTAEDAPEAGAYELGIEAIEVWHEDDGWIEISDTAHTLELAERSADARPRLLGQAHVPAKTYRRIRLTLSPLIAQGAPDETTRRAVMPQPHLAIDATLIVREAEATGVVLTLDTNRSLHSAQDGTLVFLPVIHIESRSGADVAIHDERVALEGGRSDTNATLGMQLSGAMRTNRVFDGALTVSEAGVIRQAVGADDAGDAGASTPPGF